MMNFLTSLLICILAATNVVQAAGGWLDSCYAGYAFYPNTQLWAECLTNWGVRTTSTLNLNYCLANYNGQLACADK